MPYALVLDAFAPLIATAVGLGVVHTALGPDHYVPFVALAQARRWSASRTALVTLGCGLAHVASSALLGLAGVLLGTGLLHLERVEEIRGALAAWLMAGFGLTYFVWGVRHALRRDGHAHPHPRVDPSPHHGVRDSTSAWTLFLIFAFGPCEPLIPLLFYPAATAGPRQVVLVVLAFTAATLTTMLSMVFAGLRLDPRRAFPALAHWEHAIGGLAVVACGAAMGAGL